jgi:aminopeptidase N
MEDTMIKNAAYAPLLSIVKNDTNRALRAQAIVYTARYKKMENVSLFRSLLKTDSYIVQGAALWAVNLLAPVEALPLAKQFENDNKGDLSEAIYTIYTGSGNDDEWLYTYKAYLSKFAEQRFKITEKFSEITGRVRNPAYAQQGIEAIKSLAIQYKQYGVAPRIIPLLNNIKAKRLALNDQASADAIDKAIRDIDLAKE